VSCDSLEVGVTANHTGAGAAVASAVDWIDIGRSVCLGFLSDHRRSADTDGVRSL
jgi:hypothetical protein